MTNRMIENRVKKIRDLEQQKQQLEAEIEKIKSELKVGTTATIRVPKKKSGKGAKSR